MSLQYAPLGAPGQAQSDCHNNQIGIGQEARPPAAQIDTAPSRRSSSSLRDGDDLYALIPAALLRSRPPGMTDGALMLLVVWLAWRARWTAHDEDRRHTPVRPPAAHWATELNVSRRHAKRWIRELRATGLVVATQTSPGTGSDWIIPETGSCWSGPRVAVPLALVHRLASAPSLVVTWAVLRSYVSQQTGTAWPSQERLCQDMGVSHRTTVADRIARLGDLGCVEARRRATRGRSYEYRCDGACPSPKKDRNPT